LLALGLNNLFLVAQLEGVVDVVCDEEAIGEVDGDEVGELVGGLLVVVVVVVVVVVEDTSIFFGGAFSMSRVVELEEDEGSRDDDRLVDGVVVDVERDEVGES